MATDNIIDTNDHREALRALVQKARVDFLTYILLFNPPSIGVSLGVGSYVLSKPHAYLASIVQGVMDKTRKPRQITSMPPQHGKSTLLSKEAVSWIVGRQAGVQVALTSFSHELVTDFSKSIRSRITDPLYQLIFPEAKLSPLYNTAESWALTNGSGVRAKSVGKKLTGRRVDWLVIDDAHSGRREAESALSRKLVRQWYFGDCVTRLSPEGVVFIVGTRWHPEDLIGSLTSAEYVSEMIAVNQTKEIFEKTNLPAIAEDDNDDIGRMRGEALFPEVRGLEFLDNLRASIPAYEWESQYQGNPQTAGSGQIDTTRIKKIALADVPTHIEWVRGWDLALTEKKSSDFTAGVMCAYDKKEDHFYIIDCFHDKLVWTKLKPKIISISTEDQELHNVNRIGMEAVVGFDIGFQEIRDAMMGKVKVEKRNPRVDKLMRAQKWINKIEAGKVSMVTGWWSKKMQSEMSLFPDGEHDDMIDGISICWEMLAGGSKLMYFANSPNDRDD